MDPHGLLGFRLVLPTPIPPPFRASQSKPLAHGSNRSEAYTPAGSPGTRPSRGLCEGPSQPAHFERATFRFRGARRRKSPHSKTIWFDVQFGSLHGPTPTGRHALYEGVCWRIAELLEDAGDRRALNRKAGLAIPAPGGAPIGSWTKARPRGRQALRRPKQGDAGRPLVRAGYRATIRNPRAHTIGTSRSAGGVFCGPGLEAVAAADAGRAIAWTTPAGESRDRFRMGCRRPRSARPSSRRGGATRDRGRPDCRRDKAEAGRSWSRLPTLSDRDRASAPTLEDWGPRLRGSWRLPSPSCVPYVRLVAGTSGSSPTARTRPAQGDLRGRRTPAMNRRGRLRRWARDPGLRARPASGRANTYDLTLSASRGRPMVRARGHGGRVCRSRTRVRPFLDARNLGSVCARIRAISKKNRHARLHWRVGHEGTLTTLSLGHRSAALAIQGGARCGRHAEPSQVIGEVKFPVRLRRACRRNAPQLIGRAGRPVRQPNTQAIASCSMPHLRLRSALAVKRRAVASPRRLGARQSWSHAACRGTRSCSALREGRSGGGGYADDRRGRCGRRASVAAGHSITRSPALGYGLTWNKPLTNAARGGAAPHRLASR